MNGEAGVLRCLQLDSNPAGLRASGVAGVGGAEH